MKQNDYLFVYGTLRKNYSLKLKEKVARNITYFGQAKVSASLYDIGRYPGAIKEKDDSEVIGDVFTVNDPDKVFKFLDDYEGDKFIRQKNKVTLRSGKSINAWIYWYGKRPVDKRKLPYKDYLNYLKYKKLPDKYGAL